MPVPLLAVVNACIAESEWTPSARSQRYNPVTELVIAAAEDLRNRHYAGADGWGHWSTSCARGLLDSVEPGATSRIVTALVDRLDDETGSRVFAAYIQSVGK